MRRSASFGPYDGAGAAGTIGMGAATGGPWGAALAAGAVGLNALQQGMAGGDQEDLLKRQIEAQQQQTLIGLLQDEMMRQQQNRQMGAEIPLRQQLMRNILDPTANQHGRLAANLTPRTYQSGTPGVPSMTPPTTSQGPPGMFGMPTQQTQYGAPASPQQLASLVPDFSKFAGASQKAQQMTAGITPEAYQRDSTLPLLNQFDLTRGSYLSGDNGINEAGEESLVNQLGQGQRPQDIAPGGRAPFRGDVSQIPTENRRADGWSDQDIQILQRAKANGATPVELEMLKRQLRNDGR